ncbi:MAG: PQQ-binding-like beta-propeller repeat protein [Phycisphaerales bacterium]
MRRAQLHHRQRDYPAGPARHSCLPAVLLAMVTAIAVPLRASAQFDDNPVYVDDSPRAWELFQRAGDQQAENTGEAARLYQELLDNYADKLIPAAANDNNRFASVRARVHAALRAAPDVLERYRQMQTPAAQRLLEDRKLSELLATRFLTAPAVEAAILESQRLVEDARFHSALALLEEVRGHPDLDERRAAFRFFLEGLAAQHTDDTELRQVALNSLENWSTPLGRQLHADLRRLLERGPGPAIVQGLSPLDVGPNADVASMVENPIWQMVLPNTLPSRLHGQSERGGASAVQLQSARDSGTMLTVAPTAAGAAIYVNEGHTIRALDRFSEREFWATDLGTPASVADQRSRQGLGDLASIAVDGQSLVTITGHAGPQGRIGTARVVCIDRTTGAVRWSVDFDRLNGDAEFDGLFPHSHPLIIEGRVYITARKIGRQALVSSYVIALDLADGQVVWTRYVASCGGLQNATLRPFALLREFQGDLYFASGLGAVARIEPQRGEITWLVRLNLPLRPLPSQPWEMPCAAVTERSVFLISPDETQIIELARDSGQTLQRYAAREWGSPRYLLNAGGSWIFAIGGDVVGIHLDTPLTPVWKLSDSVQVRSYDFVRGRVQVAGRTLVVPTRQEVMMIDSESGEVLRTIETNGATVPLAIGPELFAGQVDRILAFVPVSVAEARLRQQLAESNGDPESAISLVRLSLLEPDAERSVQLALEASQLAIESVNAMPAGDARQHVRDTLFELLVEVASRSSSTDLESGNAVHNMLASMAEKPFQIVEQRLAEAEWRLSRAPEDQGELQRAVELLQSILTDDSLATSSVEADHIARPAELIVLGRLKRITTDFAATASGLMQQRATERLTALADPNDIAGIAEVLREFPLAPDVRDRAVAAVKHPAAQPRAGFALLQRLEQTAPTAEVRASHVAEMITLAKQAGWHDLASAWGSNDDNQQRTHPVRPLPKLGGFAAQEQQSVPALEGRLVPIDPAASVPSDWCLLATRESIMRIDSALADQPPVAWATKFPTYNPSVLAVNQHGVLIWQSDINEAILLNPEDGSVLWQSGALEERLKRPGATRQAITHPATGERMHASSVEPAVLGDFFYAAGRSGGLLRMNLKTRPADDDWTTDHSLQGVFELHAHDLGLVVSGERRAPATNNLSGCLLIVDPQTGSIRREITLAADERIMWTILTPRGRCIFSSAQAIYAVDLASGSDLWTNTGNEVAWYQRAFPAGEDVLLADEGSRLTLLDGESGRLVAEFVPEMAEADDPTELINATESRDGRILALYRNRIVWFDRQGTVVGQDARAQDRNYVHAILHANGVAAINHLPDRNRARNASKPYVDTIHLLSQSCALVDERGVLSERNDPPAAMAINDWILITGNAQTVAVPIRQR